MHFRLKFLSLKIFQIYKNSREKISFLTTHLSTNRKEKMFLHFWKKKQILLTYHCCGRKQFFGDGMYKTLVLRKVSNPKRSKNIFFSLFFHIWLVRERGVEKMVYILCTYKVGLFLKKLYFFKTKKKCDK
jgi:hypothetical protein